MPNQPKPREIEAGTTGDLISASHVPCCPELSKKPCCDRITFSYRLLQHVRDVTVEVTIEAELERCPEGLSLGDLVYSTTLLPGETVRLYTSSRKNRFTFDAESQLSYRHEQTSEESFYMSSMSQFMSDLTSREDVRQDQQSEGSFKTNGSVSGALETLVTGASAKVSGSHSGRSILDFSRELTSHAEGSHERSVQATRAASSVSVGEVQTRSHSEGESESTFEAATRTLSNPNRCHAVTYFAYQIDKLQVVRFRIRSIRRRVVDPAGDSAVVLNPPRFSGEVTVIPQGVLATDTDRVTKESVGRASSVADRAGVIAAGGDTASRTEQFFSGSLLTARDLRAEQPVRLASQLIATSPMAPLKANVHKAALDAVDEDLVSVGLLDRVGGQLSQETAQELSFEIRSCLPTPALLVKGCRDECDVCEPARKREIELELDRKELENQLLARRIELLEQSQEYRCCPAGEAEDEGDDN